MIKRIGIIGDSIAHGFFDEENLGWFARLAQKILKQHPGEYVFNNMSQAGDNIADATNRAEFEATSREFDLILVNIGINDLRRRKNSNLQLDFSEGARIMYWNKLLNILQKTSSKIVVMDLTPVVETKYTEDASLTRYNTDIKRYNEIIEKNCKSHNIPLFKRFDKWINKDLNNVYKDATHPNAQGHEIIACEIFEYLNTSKLI
jgi:lysophospholipase L1-like esterase